MQVNMKVIGKGLKGKNEKPYVTFAIAGHKLTLMLESEEDMSHYKIQDVYTVSIEKDATQKTLDES